MLSPGKIGDITEAALVLVQFEHETLSHKPPASMSKSDIQA
jgi:hypothetical protein